ncbi:hypothetical protein HK102_000845 [Quaeritorhiza haematococci]|nr:hypothetical protein HK102_000845 [Quaeritorhiza haematococci]
MSPSRILWARGYAPNLKALFEICPSLKWIYATRGVARALDVPHEKVEQIVSTELPQANYDVMPGSELEWDEEDKKMESFRDYMLTRNPASYWAGCYVPFSVEELQQEQTLLYVGAGWDMEFLNYRFDIPHRITTYVCVDALPMIPHYNPRTVGYISGGTERRLLYSIRTCIERFATIKSHTRKGDRLQYDLEDGRKVIYWINRKFPLDESRKEWEVCRADIAPSGMLWARGFSPDLEAVFDICPSLKWIYVTDCVDRDMYIPEDKVMQTEVVPLPEAMNQIDPGRDLKWDDEDTKMEESWCKYMERRDPASYWHSYYTCEDASDGEQKSKEQSYYEFERKIFYDCDYDDEGDEGDEGKGSDIDSIM